MLYAGSPPTLSAIDPVKEDGAFALQMCWMSFRNRCGPTVCWHAGRDEDQSVRKAKPTRVAPRAGVQWQLSRQVD